MKQPISPELLASLLDGTLTAEERRRVLAQLAADEDAYELLVESGAVAIAAGLAPRRARWRAWLPVGLAAAVVLAVIGVRLASRDQPAESTLQLARTAALGVRGQLDPDPGPVARWPIMAWESLRRGSVPFSSRGIAFRMGLCLTDLELAAAVGDSASVKLALFNIRELSAGRPEGWRAVERFDEFSARGSAPSPGERAQAAKLLRKLVPEPEWIELGAAMESARIAAASGQGEFFRPDHELVRTLRRLTDRVPPVGPMTADFPHLLRIFVDGLGTAPQTSLRDLHGRLTDLIVLGGK